MRSRSTTLTWAGLVLGALLPIGLLGLYAFRVASDSIKDLVGARNQSAVTFTADMVRRDFEQGLNLVHTFAGLPGLRGEVEKRDVQRVRDRLRVAVEAFPMVDRAFVTDPSGVLWTDYPAAAESLGQSFAYRHWYRSLTNSAGPIVSEVYERHAEPRVPVLAFATRIVKPSGEVLGMVVCQYRLERIVARLKQMSLGVEGEVFLLDPSGKLAAHPTLPPMGANSNRYAGVAVIKGALAGTAATTEYHDPVQDRKVVASVGPVSIGARWWAVVAEQPVAQAYAPIGQLAVQLSIASGILALGAAGLVVLLERSSVRNRRLNQQMARDVTEKKQAEETLARERFLVDTLMENIPDHIYFKDRSSRFIRINPAMAAIFRLQKADEAVGKTDSDFFTSEHAQRAFDDEQEILRTGQAMVNREEKETWPDGTITWVSTTKQTLRDKSGQTIGTFGISRDITDRKRAEEALALKAQELARSNAELEQFAYAASHDLQEPLRMVASYTQLLARRYKDKLDADAHEFIRFAVDGALRMQVLINDLLAYSRVGTRGKPFAATDCAEVLQRVLANLTVAIQESNAKVHCSRLPVVLADATQLMQLFQNLIANALKFRADKSPEVQIEATLKENETAEWLFCVRDNGIGIDPQYFERIFVIFQRLHSREEYPGTGIGLAVCRKIVERHGGRIWLESQPGQGAAFFFTVPHRDNFIAHE